MITDVSTDHCTRTTLVLFEGQEPTLEEIQERLGREAEILEVTPPSTHKGLDNPGRVVVRP